MKKKTIKKILDQKGKKPITCLTAYSKDIAKILDKNCDIVLVGDSVGMVLYGMKDTKKVLMNTMILHGTAVRNSVKKSLVVIDMPSNTYTNKLNAYKNARKLMNSTRCDAVKLEGGKEKSNIINYLVRRRIPVMGHVGLLPQTSRKFELKGKNSKEREKIFKDALAVSKAGAFAIVLECIVESLAKKITSSISVPTIGIGASKYCDGQVLVIDDILGLNDFSPRFVKRYSNLKEIIKKSVKRYCRDVKLRRFPSSKNIYN